MLALYMYSLNQCILCTGHICTYRMSHSSSVYNQTFELTKRASLPALILELIYRRSIRVNLGTRHHSRSGSDNPHKFSHCILQRNVAYCKTPTTYLQPSCSSRTLAAFLTLFELDFDVLAHSNACSLSFSLFASFAILLRIL